MGTWAIKVVLVFCFCNSVLSIHTSDKLDFGETPYRSSLVKGEKKLPLKVTRTVDTITSPSEHVSISCGPTGCNTTNNNNTVETEVVVRVKTNVNLDKNQDKTVDDISDVPIVVGYRGSIPDETPNEEQFRSYPPVTPDPIEISSRSDFTPLRPLYTDSPVFIGRRYGDQGSSRYENHGSTIFGKQRSANHGEYGSTRSDVIPQRPLITDSPIIFGEEYRRQGLNSDMDYEHGSLNYRSRTPYSTTPAPYDYHGSTSTNRISNGYYDSSSPRTDILSRYPDSSSPRIEPNDYYDYSSPRTVEINGISSPIGVTIPDLNRRNYNYNTFRENRDELQIPYLEHTYIRHYFGEEPPSHTLLYPKINSYNPVEFKNIPKNKWRPSVWNGRQNKYAFTNPGNNFINPYTHNHDHHIPYSHTQQKEHGDIGCACREQRTEDESNPYAASSTVNRRIAVQKKDPGVSIDDKLGPLN